MAKSAKKRKKKLSFFLENLKDNKGYVRRKAIKALRKLGKEALFAIPALHDVYRDDELGDLRREAEKVVTELVQEQGVVSVLRRELHHADWEVRRGAAWALEKAGGAAREAIPALMEALKDEHREVCYYAASALSRLGEEAREAIPALIEALNSEGAHKPAACALKEMGVAPVAVLVEELSDEEERLRCHAAGALLKMEENSYAAVSALVKALRDPNKSVRRDAALSFCWTGEFAEDDSLEAALIESLHDKDEEVRTAAACALGAIHQDAFVAVPASVEALLLCLYDEVATVRATAASALKRIGRQAQEAIPALVEALGDRDKVVQNCVAEALGDIAYNSTEEKARAAAFALSELLQKEGEEVCEKGIEALTAIGEEASAALPALRKIIGEKNHLNRHHAVAALGRIGKEAQEAIPDLLEALYEEEEVRANAASALGRIGEGPEVVAALAGALQDESSEVRIDVANALGEMGKKASATTPALLKALQDEEEEVREAAAIALGRIGEGIEEALPILKRMLQQPHHYLWEEVVWTLATIGEEAKSSIPLLLENLQRPESISHIPPLYALGKMGQEGAEALLSLQQDPHDYLVEEATFQLLCLGYSFPEELSFLQTFWRGRVDYLSLTLHGEKDLRLLKDLVQIAKIFFQKTTALQKNNGPNNGPQTEQLQEIEQHCRESLKMLRPSLREQQTKTGDFARASLPLLQEAIDWYEKIQDILGGDRVKEWQLICQEKLFEEK